MRPSNFAEEKLRDRCTKSFREIHRDNGKRFEFVFFSEKAAVARACLMSQPPTILSDLRRRIAAVTTHVGNNGLRTTLASESEGTEKNVCFGKYDVISVSHRA